MTERATKKDDGPTVAELSAQLAEAHASIAGFEARLEDTINRIGLQDRTVVSDECPPELLAKIEMPEPPRPGAVSYTGETVVPGEMLPTGNRRGIPTVTGNGNKRVDV